MSSDSSQYDSLCAKSREISLLGNTAGVLGWDQETYMPKNGVAYRAKQLSWLSGKIHELGTSDDFREALEGAEQEEGDATQQANVREIRHSYDRSTKLPRELVEKSSEATSLGKAAWAEARQKSDFSLFAPHLSTLLDIARQKAELWGYEEEPYDALLEGFERGAKTSQVAAIFDAVDDELAATAQEACERSLSQPSDILSGHYPIADQQTLNREIAEDVGFDFDGGRIDTTTHPFCTGLGPGDTRLTTRYLEDNFTSSLFGVLHEAGHGLYNQGLPKDQHGLPAGNAVSLGIHESQSRLWENHVGRSRAFWTKWLPRAQEIFPNLAKLDLDTFLTAINRAEKTFIRVEADEATYDLHILLRFGLERKMLNREIEVADVPAAWNESFEKLFAMTPPDDTHGCLQDIHWSMGGLGYFSTYTLGNFNAAQLYHSAMQDQQVASGCEQANYQALLQWMRENIHQQGSVLFPQDLMKAATGEGTNPRFHLDHLKRRFLK
ncbi:carboxypeptidase M32 [Verrucomicrobiaceae bacterium R5-34]|uniref:Metal-dependent carboxypeptidase n=1 Tax=Oceaniferula flava TaxID=2800421 RepID=A0AAE2SCM7_9BACT|nr:carboxypeptidase M32 [Oceaniferula flavus]MBK1830720.1 carboxypeptidase M32 [Verrucomicrobiaceae bacterium R5-34]MBK1855978.1 carboxypeptidase M32 [Oceaniferula flavus]MBM1137285.1 carboxypeptidase M32 [Oceaniferula flavus]